MTATDTRERPSVASLVELALGVPGVRGVSVDRDRRGDSLLRLDLEPGADERRVAEAVSVRLRRDGAPAAPAAAPAAATDAAAPVAGRPAAPAAPVEEPFDIERVEPSLAAAPAAPGTAPAAATDEASDGTVDDAPRDTAASSGEPVDGETVPAGDAADRPSAAAPDAREGDVAPLLGAAALFGAAAAGGGSDDDTPRDRTPDDRTPGDG